MSTSNPVLARKDKLAMVSNLSTMLKAGIPLLEAVEGLREEANKKDASNKVLAVLHESLSQGHPLSHAMAKLPRAFDPVSVNLVKAAEEAGTLERTLKDLSEAIKRDMAFADQIKSALTYPAFVMIIFVGVLTFILAFVIPRLGRVFAGFEKLPPATKFLLDISGFMLGNYVAIIGVVIALIAVVIWLFRTRRRQFINLFLSLPGMRTLGRQIDLSNFTRSMGLLLSAGIPVSEALRFSESVAVKQDILEAVHQMERDVNSGQPMSHSLRLNKKVIPSMMVRLTETAEISGTLESTMHELADYFELQVSRTLKTLTTLLEPVMLVLMGLLVGGMMLAVIAPMYSLISQLNGPH